jgi:predicted  nucleic acid-binding Zn-ribbon protein
MFTDRSRVSFIASKYAPEEKLNTYWVDLSADPIGTAIKAFNGSAWVLVDPEDDITAKIDAIKVQIDELDLDTLSSIDVDALSGIQDVIDAIKLSIKDNTDDITAMATEMATFQADFSDVLTAHAGQISQNNKENATLQGLYKALATDVTSLSTEVATISSKITDLSSADSGFATAIATMSTNISDLKSRDIAFATEMATLASDIRQEFSSADTTLGINISALATEMATSMAALSGSITNNASSIEDLYTEIATLQAIDAEHATKITEIATDIINLESSVSNIDSDLINIKRDIEHVKQLGQVLGTVADETLIPMTVDAAKALFSINIVTLNDLVIVSADSSVGGNTTRYVINTIDEDGDLHWTYGGTYTGGSRDFSVIPINEGELANDAVTDNIIGDRTLADNGQQGTLVPILAKKLTPWLQGLRDNIKYAFNKLNTKQDALMALPASSKPKLIALGSVAGGYDLYSVISGSFQVIPDDNSVPSEKLVVDTLSSYQLKSNAFSGSYTDLTNKPTLFSGSYSDLSGAPNLSNYLLSTNSGTGAVFFQNLDGGTIYNLVKKNNKVSLIRLNGIDTLLEYRDWSDETTSNSININSQYIGFNVAGSNKVQVNSNGMYSVTGNRFIPAKEAEWFGTWSELQTLHANGGTEEGVNYNCIDL